LVGDLGFGAAANLADLRGPAGGGDGLLRALGPAFHAGFGLFGVATFLGCDGPGVAFLAGDLPRGLVFCTGRELPALLWLLDPAGVVFRVSGLPREGGGALLALWRPLGNLDCAPGPAFHAGFGDGERELSAYASRSCGPRASVPSRRRPSKRWGCTVCPLAARPNIRCGLW